MTETKGARFPSFCGSQLSCHLRKEAFLDSPTKRGVSSHLPPFVTFFTIRALFTQFGLSSLLMHKFLEIKTQWPVFPKPRTVPGTLYVNKYLSGSKEGGDYSLFPSSCCQNLTECLAHGWCSKTDMSKNASFNPFNQQVRALGSREGSRSAQSVKSQDQNPALPTSTCH